MPAISENANLKLKIIVTDTGPLITLAAAGNLDYLTKPGLPVFIPDGVYYEAVDKALELKIPNPIGIADIVNWSQQNGPGKTGLVHIVPSQPYANFLTQRKSNPAHTERDLGERCALDVIRYGIVYSPDERTILLLEDDKARQVFVVPSDHDKMVPLTTRDYLNQLEQNKLIPSADDVYQRATAAGRNPSQTEILKSQPQNVQDSVRDAFR